MGKLPLLFLLLFLTSKLKAQDIQFADSNFLKALLQSELVIDTNHDSRIQIDEALLVKDLNISQKEIHQLKGIEYFTNLEILDCSYNELEELEISALTKLQMLFCNYNQLKFLNLIKNIGLLKAECMNNQLDSLYIGSRLYSLHCNDNQLTQLKGSKFSNLNKLVCSYNKITSFDCSKFLSLELLDLTGNLLTNIRPNADMKRLDVNFNLLTKINLVYARELEHLGIAGNKIQELKIHDLRSLKSIVCSSNQLKKLTLFNLPKFTKLQCSDNHLQWLHLKDGIANSININASNNPITMKLCSDENDTLSFENNFKLKEIHDCDYSRLIYHQKSISKLNNVEQQAFQFFKDCLPPKEIDNTYLDSLTQIKILSIKNYFAIAADIPSKKYEKNYQNPLGHFVVKMKRIDHNNQLEYNKTDWTKLFMSESFSQKDELKSTIYEMAEMQYDDVEYMKQTNDYAFVSKAGKWGLLNDYGNEEIEIKYDSISMSSAGVLVKLNGKWGITNDDGELATPIKYDDIERHGFPRVSKTRLLAVIVNGKYGCLNPELKEVIPIIYDNMEILAFKYVVGTLGYKKYLLNEMNGELKCKLAFKSVRYFSENLLAVTDAESGKGGLINGEGEVILDLLYDQVMDGNMNVYVYKRNGKFGLMNREFKEITKPVYDRIEHNFEGNHTNATRNGKEIILLEDGKEQK